MLWFTQVTPENVLLKYLCQKTEEVLDTSRCPKLQTLMRVSIIWSWCHTSTGYLAPAFSTDDGHSALLRHWNSHQGQRFNAIHKANATRG